MKRTSITTLGLVLFALPALLPVRAFAQSRTTSGVRAKIVDEKGAPLEGVKVEMEFVGESRVKITKSQLTDKKGGFIRTGIPGGKWKLTLTKDGFKPYTMETDLSSGGFSDLPDIVMKEGAVAAAAPAAPTNEVAPVMPKEVASTMKDVYNKAVEASRAGNLDEAETAYKEILAQVELAEVHYNLGQVYVRKKDLDSAEGEFQKAVEQQPTRADFYLALKALYTIKGKANDAAELMVRGAPNFEQDARYQFVLATALLDASRNDAATAAFQKVLALDPNNAEPHYHLATILIGQNKAAEAVAELQKFVAGSNQDAQLLATAKKLIEALKKR